MRNDNPRPERADVRVLVLDGVDWDYVTAHESDLKNLFAVARDGCMARLEVCDPPLTPAAVCTLLSGRRVDQPWIANDHYTTSQDVIRANPWLPDLARAGRTAGLCNIPLTWPAFQVPPGSWMTSGFPVPSATLTGSGAWRYPSRLDVRRYPIGGVVRDCGVGGTRNLRDLQTTEESVMSWLLSDAPRSNVEIVWLRLTDSAGHHYFGGPEYRLAMAHADQMVDLARRGTRNLLVISDHGFDLLTSPRCDRYNATSHGPASAAAGLHGGHTMDGVLFAAGEDVRARGLLADQKLEEVAGGLFDLLQVPPPPGMISRGPAWANAVPAGSAVGADIAARMKSLGYM